MTEACPTLVTPRRFADDRGWFTESWNQDRFAGWGLPPLFVQDNQSFSRDAGTVRGLHFQAPPYAQGKLVRVLAGAILDVAVDIRRGSPTYGQWLAVELDAGDGRQFYIPTGYAHGFITRVPDTMVAYKVTAAYHQASEGGLIWNDPDLAIDWPSEGILPTLSAKDAVLPGIDRFESPFVYDGVPMTLAEFHQ